ncbi:MAG: glutamate racemase [Spirochaetia bacterium]|jgi:glutamate racemase
MSPEPVAFLDSGVGGLPYLNHARRLITGRRFVYVADRANFPYGEKDRRSIIDAAVSVAERLIQKENPRLIVVACNTMSVVALAALRERFSLPFVGVVPAIKPAAALSRRRCVGILATRQTVEGEYLRGLIEKHASGCSVVSLPSAGLVEFVEKELYQACPEEREDRVRAEVTRFRSEGIDALVLGCTHFLHLEPEFRRLLETDRIALVDSREGVSRQVRRLLSESPAAAAPLPRDSLYVTGAMPVESRYAWFADQFGLCLEGTL